MPESMKELFEFFHIRYFLIEICIQHRHIMYDNLWKRKGLNMSTLYSSLDLRYRLVPGADHTLVPSPVYLDNMGIVYLKTRRTINLKYNSILKVPTGVELLPLPMFSLNSTPDVKVMVVGHCYSIPELEEEEGLSVLGPRLITPSDHGEIELTIKNYNQTIFHADQGDPIAILAYEIIPYAALSLAPLER